jgi:hypothetical protein
MRLKKQTVNRKKQIARDEYYMDLARAVESGADCLGTHVGAVNRAREPGRLDRLQRHTRGLSQLLRGGCVRCSDRRLKKEGRQNEMSDPAHTAGGALDRCICVRAEQNAYIWLESMGFKPARLPAAVVGLAEFGGGVLLALGLITPLGAAAVAGVMFVAIVTVHWSNGFFNASGGYEFNLLIAATAIALAVTGPGEDLVRSPRRLDPGRTRMGPRSTRGFSRRRSIGSRDAHAPACAGTRRV